MGKLLESGDQLVIEGVEEAIFVEYDERLIAPELVAGQLSLAAVDYPQAEGQLTIAQLAEAPDQSIEIALR